jgi:hypothetical protein
MRSFLGAISLLMVVAALCNAQLLDPRDNAAKKDAPGAPAADAKGNVANVRPGARDAAPQPNAMFAAIDTDGDGVISKVELRKAIKALKSLDADNDGNITLAEASPGGGPATGLAGRPPGVGPVAGGREADISKLVARYDVNNDKMLSTDEVPPGIARMIRPTDDVNGNGQLDAAELQLIVARSGVDPRVWAAGPKNAAQRTPFRDPSRRLPRDERKGKN